MAVALKDIEELLDAKLSGEAYKDLLETLHGLSLNLDFCEELASSNPKILCKIVRLAGDKTELCNIALEFLINFFSHDGLISKVLDGKANKYLDFIHVVVNIFMKSSDSVVKSISAQLLANITRQNTSFFDDWKNSDASSLDIVFKTAFLKDQFREEEKLREEALMIILNLSQNISCQKYIVENLKYVADILFIAEICSERYLISLVGLFKNLLKISSYHEDLLKKTNLLVVLLKPLVGLNDYEEKIINGFPESLKKYAGSHDVISLELRSVILECLYLLSATKLGRVTLRDSNVYDILKNVSELDLSDSESDNCLDCIGLLIRTEDEIGFDDLLTVHIPEDVQDKFNN